MHLFWGVLTVLTCLECENKTVVESALVKFQDRPVSSRITEKHSSRPSEIWVYLEKLSKNMHA